MISNFAVSHRVLQGLAVALMVLGTFLSALLPSVVVAQTLKRRYVLWPTPVARNTQIYGIGFGPLSVTSGKANTLLIDGVNLEILPLSIFTLPGSMVGSMLAIVPGGPTFMEKDSEIRTTIKGINISGGTFEGVGVRGLSLNLFNSYSTEMNGVELSLFSNSHARFKGCIASLWGNRSRKGAGVQIGIFNTCEEGRVFQFGFLNRIGKRVLPVINFSFKRRK